MKKLLFTMLAILSLCVGLTAQTVVTVPLANTNTGSVNDPFGAYFGYERTALIYTPSELGGNTGNIQSLSFYVNSLSSAATASNVSIYLKERTTTFSTASTYTTETTGATLVYGPIDIPASAFVAGGWFTVYLASPFSYTGGTNNLEVIIETNATGGGSGETSTSKQFRYATATNNQYYQSWNVDTSPPTTTTGTRSTSRPNIQVAFGPLVTCFPPTALVSSPSTYSATFSWNASVSSPSGGYEWEVRTSGAVGSGTTGLSGSGSTLAGIVTASLSGLTASTTHSLFVRSNCGASDFSTWATVTFTTLNAPCLVPTSQPTGLTFGGVTNSAISGTFTAATPTVSNYLVIRTLGTAPNTPTNGVVYTTGTSAALGGTVVSVGSGTTFTSSSNIVGNTNYSYYVYAYNTGTCAPAYLTTIPLTSSITTCPSTPGTATVSGLSLSAFNLNWGSSVGGGANPVTYTLDVSTVNNFTSAIVGSPFVVSTNSTSISGLTANTQYFYRIMASNGCSTVYTSTASVTTLCNATITFPYSEGFDATTLPSCWSVSQISGTNTWTTHIGTSDNDGVPAARTGARFAGKSYTNSDGLLISPPFNLSSLGSNPAWVNLWIYRNSSSAAADRIRVHLNTTNSLSGATQILEIFPRTTVTPTVSANGWYNYTANIPVSFNSGGSFYVLIQGTTSSGFSSYGIGFDDFILEQIPTCYPPTALTTTNITNSSVEVSWTAPVTGTTTAYNYEIRTSGAAGTGTTGLALTGTVTAPTNSVQVTGLYSGTSYSVYLKSDCGSGDLSSWSAAKTFSTVTTCTVPTNVVVSGISNMGAVYSWTSAATAFDLYYGTSPLSAPFGGTLPTATTSATSYTASGLAVSTPYALYVRAQCGSGDMSTWTAIKTFTTLCNPLSTFPYTESFSSTFPSCWAVSEGTTGASQHWESVTADASYGVASPQSGTNFMRLDVFSASKTYNTYNLISPSFSLPATPKQISYKYFLGNSGYKGTSASISSTVDPYPLSLQVSTDYGLTWTTVYSHSSSNSIFSTSSSTVNWQSNTVILGAYTNKIAIFRFVSNSNYSSGICNQGLDEIVIDDAPACAPPTALTTTNTLGYSTNLSWTAPSTGTPANYIWEVRASGAAGSGTTGIVATGTVSAPTTSVLVAGLTPTTAYSVYVSTDCGSSIFSSWTPAKTFTTTVSCPAPTSLTINNIMPTAATASWTAGASESSWYVQYAAPTTTATASTPSYSLSGLSPTTNYTVSVKAVCSITNDSSVWVTKTFATPCLPPNILSTTSSVRCGVGTTTLSATTDPGAILNWYATPTGGTALGTGTLFTTPTLTTTTDFYVSTANVFAGTPRVGSGLSTGVGVAYNPTQGGYGGLKGQYLFTATELLNSGLVAGNITSLALDVTSAGSTLSGFAIQVGTTTLTTFASPVNIQSGLTTVYPATTFTPVVGLNTFNLSTPFNWDGSSNVIVSLSWSNNNISNTSSSVKYDATTNFASQTFRQDNQTDTDMLAFAGSTPIGVGTSTFDRSQNRPVFVFGANTACTSARSVVTASVSTPPALALTTGTTVCSDIVAPLTITSTLSDYDSYVWTPVTNLYTDAAATTAYTGGTATTVYYKSTLADTKLYTVNATSSLSGCGNIATTTMMTDVPVVLANISPTVICSASTVTLNATTNAVVAGTKTVGTNSLADFTGGPYREGAGSENKVQYLFTASELNAAGIFAGNITSATFSVTSVGTGTMGNFTIRMGATSSTSIGTTYDANPATLVYGPVSYKTVSGANVHTFTTPFNWDGISNVVLQVCHDAVTAGNSTSIQRQSITNRTAYTNAASACTSTLGISVAYRAVITLSGQVNGQSAGNLNWSWNPGSISSNTAVVNPVNTGTLATTMVYTVTGTNPLTTCSNTSIVSVLVNPVPATVVANNSTQCGYGIPTASVTGMGGTYNWYNAATSGTLVQSGTSATYTTAINNTTTFYVAENNGNCEGPLTPVTVTVTTPDAITTSISSTTICPAQTVTLTATNTGTNQVYTYTWLSAANNGIATSVNNATAIANPSLAGVYEYTVVGNDGACNAIATTSLTVIAPPDVFTTATPSVVCSGSSISLEATTGAIGSGTVAIGTNTTLTGATAQPTAFCNRWLEYRMQTVYTAAELSAAGLVAGNITSIAYNITSLGDAATNDNYTVKMGTTSVSAFTDFVSSASFTTVYPAATYTNAVGVNVINFTTPFNWDGTSNLIVEVSHDGADLVNNSETYYTATSGDMLVYSIDGDIIGTPSVNRLNIIFGGQSVIKNAGALTWQWNPGSVMSNTMVVNPTNTGTSPIMPTYTVTAIDPATTCSNTAVVTVTVNPIPNVTATTANSVVCLGSSATLVGGGATTYTWLPQGGQFATTVITPTATTVYTVTGTSLGCSNTATVELVSAALPSVSATATPTNAQCAGTAITLNATGATTYTWLPTGGNAATASVTPMANTVYTVTGSNGSCSAKSTVTVNVIANPTVTATSSKTLICTSESAVLTASSSATSYTWSSNASSATTTTVTVSPTTTTNYTVTVSNGTCTASAAVSVSVSPCTGIEELSSNNISVYPNPTNGIVNIAITNELITNAVVEMYDAVGKLVIRETLTRQTSSVNMNRLEDGVYFYKIISDNQEVKIGKLIKQ